MSEVLTILASSKDITWLLDDLATKDIPTEILLDVCKAYTVLGNLRKTVDLLEYGLTKYKDMFTQVNYRSQLVCNYSRLGITHEALYHCRIVEALADDTENQWFKSFCYGLLHDPKSDEITNMLLERELTGQQRYELSSGLDRYYIDKDFNKAMKYMSLRYDNKTYRTPWLKSFEKIVPGENIVLFTGHGIGDELTMIRFMKYFEERGMTPIWYTNRQDIIDVVNIQGYKATTDLTECSGYMVNAFHLPYLLNLKPEDVWVGPYLKPSQQAIDKFSDCKGIGVRCSGSVGFEYSSIRNVDIEEIYEYLPDITKYSLTVDEVIDYKDIIPMNDRIKSIDDTLGLLYNLDYLITTCTSVAHMAAAMGKKVIIFNSVPWFAWYRIGNELFWYRGDIQIIGRDELDRWKYDELGVF